MTRHRLLARLVLLSAAVVLSLPIFAGEVERIERGNLVIEGVSEVPEEVTERLRQYQNTRSASLQGWHPSGRGILISTRFGETTQIHWVAEPGGARRQVTFFNEPVSNATPSPSAEVNGFVFAKDVGGSEFYQLFFFDLATGRSRMVSDGESRNGGATWAHDGRRYVFYTTRRNGRDWDLHVADVGHPGESRPILEKEGTWFPSEWSPDDSRLLVSRYVSANEVHPHILDVATGKLTPINPTEERVAYSAVTFSPDGKGLYYSSDEGTEFKHLRYHDLATGKAKILTADIPWDVTDVAISDDGKHLAFTTNEGGINRLNLRRLPDLREVPASGLPVGQIYGLEFSADGTQLALVVNSARTPGDVYSMDLKSHEVVRWTHSEVGGLQTGRFAQDPGVLLPSGG